MATCPVCGFPKIEVLGIYQQEMPSEDRKICINCLKKKVEELELRVNNLEREPKERI